MWMIELQNYEIMIKEEKWKKKVKICKLPNCTGIS